MTINSFVKYIIVVVFILLGFNLEAQITTNTNFEVRSNQPIDTRDTLYFLADTSLVTWKYPGLLSYVRDQNEFWHVDSSLYWVALTGPLLDSLTALTADVAALTSSLTNPYVPYWDGTKFADSPIYKGTGELIFKQDIEFFTTSERWKIVGTGENFEFQWNNDPDSYIQIDKDNQIYVGREGRDVDFIIGSGLGTESRFYFDKSASRMGIQTSTPSYSIDVNSVSAALRLNPATAPANTEGVWYSNDADDRPHYMDGVTDNALAYTSDLITNNTSTNYVPYWDGDSFENSPIYNTTEGAEVAIGDAYMFSTLNAVGAIHGYASGGGDYVKISYNADPDDESRINTGGPFGRVILELGRSTVPITVGTAGTSRGGYDFRHAEGSSSLSSILIMTDYFSIFTNDIRTLDGIVIGSTWGSNTQASHGANAYIPHEQNGLIMEGNLGVSGESNPSISIEIGGTDGMKHAVGTTAQRPAGVDGVMRFNSDLSRYEGYDDAQWNSFAYLSDISGGGISGTGIDDYVAVWDADTLRTGVIRDNGTSVGYNVAPGTGSVVHSFLGDMLIDGGTDTNPLRMTSNNASGVTYDMFNSNGTSGSDVELRFGVSATLGQTGRIGWYYDGSLSADNYLFLTGGTSGNTMRLYSDNRVQFIGARVSIGELSPAFDADLRVRGYSHFELNGDDMVIDLTGDTLDTHSIRIIDETGDVNGWRVSDVTGDAILVTDLIQTTNNTSVFLYNEADVNFFGNPLDSTEIQGDRLFFDIGTIAEDNTETRVLTHDGTSDEVGYRTINESYAGYESSSTDANGDVTVTIGSTMPDATYVALVQPEDASGNEITAVVTAKTTTTFTVRLFNAGTAINTTAVTFGWRVENY